MNKSYSFNPKPRNPPYSPGRKDLVQEIKSYEIAGRDGRGDYIQRWGCSSETRIQQEAATATADTVAA